METTNHQAFVSGENSGVILGTSSEAIVEGLHHNAFTESGSGSGLPDDDDQIVNEQDQQEIVNPQEKEYVEGESEGGLSVTGLENEEDEDDLLVDDDLPGKETDIETGTSTKTE